MKGPMAFKPTKEVAWEVWVYRSIFVKSKPEWVCHAERSSWEAARGQLKDMLESELMERGAVVRKEVHRKQIEYREPGKEPWVWPGELPEEVTDG